MHLRKEVCEVMNSIEVLWDSIQLQASVIALMNYGLPD